MFRKRREREQPDRITRRVDEISYPGKPIYVTVRVGLFRKRKVIVGYQ